MNYEEMMEHNRKIFIEFGGQVWNKIISEGEIVRSEKLERLRDEFAIEAMGKIIVIAEKSGWHWQQPEGFMEVVAKKSYMAADVMLKAREIK